MRVIDLGLTGFLETYRLQREAVEKVSLGLCENTLMITEHRPVITIGRKGSRDNVLKPGCGIDIVSADRGGDVTYHGPGQLVAYPIFKLENEGRDIHAFLHFLEDIGAHFLMQYGVTAEERPGFRGVWVGGKKIGSIGIGVKKWVTYHGLAVNINTGLLPFSFIRPCGIEGVEITSLKEILGREIDIDDAKDKIKRSFREISLLAEAASSR